MSACRRYRKQSLINIDRKFELHRSDRQHFPVMSSQVREKSEGSATDLLQMQTRLRMMTAEYEKLSRENSELRAKLHSLSDERLLHNKVYFS